MFRGFLLLGLLLRRARMCLRYLVGIWLLDPELTTLGLALGFLFCKLFIGIELGVMQWVRIRSSF